MRRLIISLIIQIGLENAFLAYASAAIAASGISIFAFRKEQ